MNYINHNIAFLREKEGLSMDKLANIIGKGKTTVKSYVDGKTYPDAEVIQKIVQHFKVSYFQLFETDLSKEETEEKEYSSLSKEELIGLLQEKDGKLSSLKKSINQFLDSKL